jgi:hypothetical protein
MRSAFWKIVVFVEKFVATSVEGLFAIGAPMLLAKMGLLRVNSSRCKKPVGI